MEIFIFKFVCLFVLLQWHLWCLSSYPILTCFCNPFSVIVTQTSSSSFKKQLSHRAKLLNNFLKYWTNAPKLQDKYTKFKEKEYVMYLKRKQVLQCSQTLMYVSKPCEILYLSQLTLLWDTTLESVIELFNICSFVFKARVNASIILNQRAEVCIFCISNVIVVSFFCNAFALLWVNFIMLL